jgi:hypothetical protein
MLVQMSSNFRLNQFYFPVARKIPFDDPEVLNYVRIAYVTAQVIILGVYYYVSYAVCLPNLTTLRL